MIDITISALDETVSAWDVAEGLRELLPTDAERFFEELVLHSDAVTIAAMRKALNHD